MITAIIGAGAAGMMAAVTASKLPGNTVEIFERQSRAGRKLAATGNGRCNMTNINMGTEHYHGDPDFIDAVLRRFDVENTLKFFASLGLIHTVQADGRVYPYSDQAGSVVDVLRLSLQKKNVVWHTGAEARSVYCRNRRFFVDTGEETVPADRLIVAAGGLAGGKLGGSDSGYRLLQRFGHSCTPLSPSLVQIKTDNKYTKALKGVRAEAEVFLMSDKGVISRSSGEVQFTDYGVSGPAVFEVSRSVSSEEGEKILKLDLLAQYSEKDLTLMLEERKKSWPEQNLEELLTGFVHNRLGRVVTRRAGFEFNRRISSLKYSELIELACLLKRFELPVTGTTGMDQAQVTAGGVPTSEFDAGTLESKLCKGLFAAGEVLDVDGDCGGYNLQWAWSSGYVAGRLGS